MLYFVLAHFRNNLGWLLELYVTRHKKKIEGIGKIKVEKDEVNSIISIRTHA